MHPVKLVWAARAVLYKLFLGHVGNMSYIGKPCFIEGRNNIRIGNKTRIFPGIRMEAIGDGSIDIGDNVALEQNIHITSAGGSLHIGNDVTIAANTFITNIEHEYEDVTLSVMDQGHILKETFIGEGCFLGYSVAIQAGTKLGKHCIVGTNSVVRGEFPDYCVIVGCPARIVKKFNVESKTWDKI